MRAVFRPDPPLVADSRASRGAESNCRPYLPVGETLATDIATALTEVCVAIDNLDMRVMGYAANEGGGA